GVGFIEEVIFRGLLFKAIAKDNIKEAIIISSVTFGLGHLVNAINGSGMDLVANLCQVVGAIAIGLLFVTIFYRSGSLLPCIITHSAIDAVSVFANEATLTPEKRILFSLSRLAIVVVYILILQKTLPRTKQRK
ncbi:MAG: CPBP family intramembrane metalloprotease, partial [Oscillospiraceae bacterium]|nr:CPBP family intramembrane metalloprotease [Oscillospiraceae bacterium]